MKYLVVLGMVAAASFFQPESRGGQDDCGIEDLLNLVALGHPDQIGTQLEHLSADRLTELWHELDDLEYPFLSRVMQGFNQRVEIANGRRALNQRLAEMSAPAAQIYADPEQLARVNWIKSSVYTEQSANEYLKVLKEWMRRVKFRLSDHRLRITLPPWLGKNEVLELREHLQQHRPYRPFELISYCDELSQVIKQINGERIQMSLDGYDRQAYLGEWPMPKPLQPLSMVGEHSLKWQRGNLRSAFTVYSLFGHRSHLDLALACTMEKVEAAFVKWLSCTPCYSVIRIRELFGILKIQDLPDRKSGNWHLLPLFEDMVKHYTEYPEVAVEWAKEELKMIPVEEVAMIKFLDFEDHRACALAVAKGWNRLLRLQLMEDCEYPVDVDLMSMVLSMEIFPIKSWMILSSDH